MSAQNGSGKSSPDVLQMARVEGEGEEETEGEGKGKRGGEEEEGAFCISCMDRLHHWGPTVKGSVSNTIMLGAVGL